MNSKQKRQMHKVGETGNAEVYGYGFGDTAADVAEETSTIFDEQQSGSVPTATVTVKKKEYKYVQWGNDDQFPYKLRNAIGDCMITAQCQQFNTQATFGKGLRFYDRNDIKKDADCSELDNFDLINNLKQMYLEMCVDMMYYYFSVIVFILDNEGKKIVHMYHKEAQNCRFTLDMQHILYGNFEEGADNTDKIEVIPWLNINHPAEDFLMRTGKMPNQAGVKEPVKDKKFAMVCRFPTVGFQFYPHMPYLSIFRDKWYDIYRLIGKGKRAKIANSSSPRYLIEIQRDYWQRLCDAEGILDPVKRKERIKEEKMKIEKFICGLENSGKTWITESYVEPIHGNVVSMVKVTNLEATKKEGGDWADDIQEASNVLCFALGVHPNLIGATPGKSQMNNSGSDKRELFTLKQTLMQPFKEVLLPPFKLLIYFNDYKNVGVEAPIVQLTTLDKHKDSDVVTSQNQNKEGEE